MITKKEFGLEGSIGFQEPGKRSSMCRIGLMAENLKIKRDMERFCQSLDWNKHIKMKLIIEGVEYKRLKGN